MTGYIMVARVYDGEQWVRSVDVQAIIRDVDKLEQELMSAHALLYQHEGGCSCAVCQKFKDKRQALWPAVVADQP
jgi:hypothetical protein